MNERNENTPEINPFAWTRRGEIVVIIFLFFGIIIFFCLIIILSKSDTSSSARMWQKEAKINLAGIQSSLTAYFERHKAFDAADLNEECLDVIKWKPLGITKYTYYCGKDNKPASDPIGNCKAPDFIPVSFNAYTVIAVGNIDEDPDCDVWFINDTGKLWNRKMLEDGRIVDGNDP